MVCIDSVCSTKDEMSFVLTVLTPLTHSQIYISMHTLLWRSFAEPTKPQCHVVIVMKGAVSCGCKYVPMH